jgi:hypothetical protein
MTYAPQQASLLSIVVPVSIWHDLGFRENPYSTAPIPPTNEGELLLVGRDKELTKVERLITSSSSHPTIEGDNGVGKTSLVSVAGYRLMRDFLLERSLQLFIPLGEGFQLTANDDLDSFRRRIYFSVARGFITHADVVNKRGLAAPDVGDVRRWLDQPIFRDGSGGVSVLGSGANAGMSTTVNDAAGWNESGFESTVETWLRDCFPTSEAGGFIGVIDNLELLETSDRARVLVEALRDTVLNRIGLRWILCGARGIVRSVASTPRLAGVLAKPMELKPIDDADIPIMVQRRIEAFAMTDDAYVPVNASAFAYIYHRLNRNLRDALNMAESYALQLDTNQLPLDPLDNLAEWLADEALESYRATRMPPRPWEVFDTLAKRGGSCSPSDFSTYGFNSPEAFRAPVKTLEDARLVTSTKADTDKRRKTISMTTRGWLVAWAREETLDDERGPQQEHLPNV